MFAAVTPIDISPKLNHETCKLLHPAGGIMATYDHKPRLVLDIDDELLAFK
jgi:hypothetical protein